MEQTAKGFIVHAYSPYGKKILYFIGRLEKGETFAIIEQEPPPSFFVRESEMDLVKHIRPHKGLKTRKTGVKTMDHKPLIALDFKHERDLKTFSEVCRAEGIRTYESDIKKIDKFNIIHRLHSGVLIEGPYTRGRGVDRVYRDAKLTPAPWDLQLRVVSLDIETNKEMNQIRAVSLSGIDPWGNKSLHKALLVGPPQNEEWIDSFTSEKELLEAFAGEIIQFDPDIITGWNVIDFDFKVIAERFAALRVPFVLGRSTETSSFLPANNNRPNKVIISGRQVIDGMWLVRSSPDHYDDYSLDTVAQKLLNTGKAVHETGADKVEVLERMYSGSPAEYCRYCLTDSRLVLDILKKTGLIELTLKRSMLTGVSLERAWTSIAPFEHLYTEHLHIKGHAAPDFGVDMDTSFGAPGGLILEPDAGIYTNVLIFDFKSLYPSIILTFNVDPLSFAFKDEDNRADKSYIKAPNGSCFHRARGILPAIIEEFFRKREEAKQEGDPVASYVYKILMNSFYGVLGTGGCRFASSNLAGAITGYGQKLLTWCKNYLTGRGYTVLYGDTDSLFVSSGINGGETDPATLFNLGSSICGEVNRALDEYISGEYGVTSRLVLEFEKVYKRLFIPAVRSPFDSKQRGRAKGYAGLILQNGEEKGEEKLEIKGMEAVRSDWTGLAHIFQRELLARVFRDETENEIKQYIKTIREGLFNGQFDDQLVYRKKLRNPVSSYTKVKPPQVRAAELAGWKDKRGKIEYYITTSGPEPLVKHESPLDYPHYLEKQLKPIALSLAEAAGMHLDDCFDPDAAGTLFDDV